MANNVNLPLTGSGDSTVAVAAEDIAGVHYQYVKQLSGAAGSTVAATLVTTTVDLSSGGSTKEIGRVAQALGSSANSWVVDGFAFSSANTIRTSVSTTVQTAVVAANANRRALIIASLSTVQTVGLAFSTAAPTTALANVSAFLAPLGTLMFGLQSGLPNFTGNIRGINLTSTTVAGGVAVTEFTST